MKTVIDAPRMPLLGCVGGVPMPLGYCVEIQVHRVEQLQWPRLPDQIQCK